MNPTGTAPGAVAPAPICQCCPRELHGPADSGRRVCYRCEERITGHLAEVGRLWPQLPDHILTTTSAPADTDRVHTSGPIGSAAPGNLGSLDLLAGGVVNRLIVHEDAWRRALGWTLTPWRGNQDQTLAGLLAFLSTNLHWACHADDNVDGLDHDLDNVLRDMRAAITGERHRVTELDTPCPLPAVDVDEQAAADSGVPACGGVLVYDPQNRRIRCRTCRTVIGHDQWADLAEDAGLLTPLARRAIADAA